ncbi:MAG TPA: hypothetical protein VHM31_19530 [Polyangia bacterium]|nr:hypothetical protein [Polyangia bacterium]
MARAEVPEDRIAAYEDQAVGVRTITPLGSDQRPASPDWDAFQGRDHHPIDPEIFLRIVGREDLARRYRHEEILKKSLMAVGGTATVVGLLYTIVPLLILNSSPVGECADGCSSRPYRISGWGLATAAAGVVTLLVGRTLNPSPIDAAEADRLARDHNERLQPQLGLSDVAAGP